MRATALKGVRLLCLVAAVLLWATIAPSAKADSETIYKRLLKSTGWINCPQPNGTSSWGSCWVYDHHQRYVITNKHVIDKSLEVTVDFPMYQRGGGGQLITAVAEYVKVAPVRGKVISFDEKRDLALCQLENMPAGIIPLDLAAAGPVPGNRVFSLGNSSANTKNKDDAKLWRFIVGKVEMRYFDVVTFSKPPILRVEATSIRCSLKTAGGDSGGPVVNTEGELVAVHSNGDRFNSFSIEVGEVKVFVERALSRRPPSTRRELPGTWTLQTTDELGRVHYSLTLFSDGRCEVYREERYDGRFKRVRDETVTVAVPGMKMQGETTLNWTNDDQFSFTLDGKAFTATRR